VKFDDIEFKSGEYISLYETNNNDSSYEIFLIRSTDLNKTLPVNLLKLLRDSHAIAVDIQREL
jgi:hypothetical protein